MYNTVDDAVALIKNAQRIIILTGAGISEFPPFGRVSLYLLVSTALGVSCGIPDFRSRDGLYASLANSGEYLLNDPQEM